MNDRRGITRHAALRSVDQIAPASLWPNNRRKPFTFLLAQRSRPPATSHRDHRRRQALDVAQEESLCLDRAIPRRFGEGLDETPDHHTWAVDNVGLVILRQRTLVDLQRNRNSRPAQTQRRQELRQFPALAGRSIWRSSSFWCRCRVSHFRINPLLALGLPERKHRRKPGARKKFAEWLAARSCCRRHSELSATPRSPRSNVCYVPAADIGGDGESGPQRSVGNLRSFIAHRQSWD